jgi:hypothetical protein
MFEKMRRNMALKVANLARKIETVGNRVAAAGERLSTRWATKAVRYEEIARLKSLRKPSVTFVRELKKGQKRVAFYNHRDSTGRVTKVWALSYQTSSGQTRIKMGTVAELRTLNSPAHRAVREVIQSYSDKRQQMNRAPRHEASQAPKQHVQKAPRHRSERAVEKPSQKPQRSHSERPAARRERSRERQNQLEQPETRQPLKVVVGPQREENHERCYTLVYVETANPDGTGTARVIRSFYNLKKGCACRDANPDLCFYGTTFERPPQQGSILPVSMNNSPEIAKRLDLLLRHQGLDRSNSPNNPGHNQTHAQELQRQTLTIAERPNLSPGR